MDTVICNDNESYSYALYLPSNYHDSLNRQTGLMEFRIAELPAHNHLLDEVQAIAHSIREHHPELAEPLIQRWTGSGQQFAKV